MFEAQVRRAPNLIALVGPDGSQVSYAALNKRTNAMAALLQAHGVGPETTVGVCLERSVDMVVAMLGTLKAGGAYLPLDPSYPDARLRYMVEDTGTRVLLTHESLSDRLQGCVDGASTVVCMDGDWQRAAKAAELSLVEAPKPTPDTLAYLIYTSGSTGNPKGVMNTHRGICNQIQWMLDEYDVGEDDAVLQKTPFTFDVSVWEIFWPLMAGARLVMARPGGHQDAAYLVDRIERERITVVHFVSSMLRLFLEEPQLASRCNSLRYVICSGEELSYELQTRFFEKLEAPLHNLYGPTEAAVHVLYWACRRDSPDRTVPIGHPVANTRIHILTESLEPVAPGETGEIYIGGVQVARGYWKQPELTAERFLPDPFTEEGGARLYRTGDLGRTRSDGAIEFLGRRDHQVKVRGFRIELGEIECVLAMHPEVQQAAVKPHEDPPGTVRLVAYIVPRNPGRPVSTDWRSYLAERLPEYMIPSSFTMLETMPLTATGKLDRRALPAPGRDRPRLDQAYVAPRNPLERFLAEVWSEYLAIDRIGIRDRFFELGGTSIQAAQVVNRLQKELGEFIYIVTLFDAPSIAEYALLLEREYGAAVGRRFGRPTASSVQSVRVGGDERLDDEAVARLERSIVRLKGSEPSVDQQAGKNPSAMFILAPPRSGTTLLRMMLAGHPRLFAGAELQLLGFHSLQERREAFTDKFSLWLEGTIRAVMDLKSCGADEAKAIMEDYERRGWTTKQFYRELQDWLGSKKLVDKSPSYALDPGTLERAEQVFQEPIYIHLVRHPYSMIRSFESYHMDQVMYLKPHAFTARRLGELVWLLSHRNIVEFLKTIPGHRRYRMRFEDLVCRPDEVMNDLCETVGLEFDLRLLQPYQDTDKKMSDGIYHDSTPMGDTKFLKRGKIDSSAAESWRGVIDNDFLSDLTWSIAEGLGYQRPSSAKSAGASAGSSSGRRRHDLMAESRAQRTARREIRDGNSSDG